MGGKLSRGLNVVHPGEPYSRHSDVIQTFAFAGELQGVRPTMEDSHGIHILHPTHFPHIMCFSLFDGHGGKQAALYSQQHLPTNVTKRLCTVLNSLRETTYKDLPCRTPSTFRSSGKKNSYTSFERKEIKSLKEIASLWYSQIDVLSLPEAKTAVTDAFIDTDLDFLRIMNPTCRAGCTAVVVLLDTIHGTVLTANLGDARAILSRNEVAIPLTEIHAPNIESEQARVVEAKGNVFNKRLNGLLAVSRAIGDLGYKTTNFTERPPIKNREYYQREEAEKLACSPVPFISVQKLSASNSDDFIVVACDGLFDVLTNQQVIYWISARLKSAYVNFKPLAADIEYAARVAAELNAKALSATPTVETPTIEASKEELRVVQASPKPPTSLHPSQKPTNVDVAVAATATVAVDVAVQNDVQADVDVDVDVNDGEEISKSISLCSDRDADVNDDLLAQSPSILLTITLTNSSSSVVETNAEETEAGDLTQPISVVIALDPVSSVKISQHTQVSGVTKLPQGEADDESSLSTSKGDESELMLLPLPSVDVDIDDESYNSEPDSPKQSAMECENTPLKNKQPRSLDVGSFDSPVSVSESENDLRSLLQSPTEQTKPAIVAAATKTSARVPVGKAQLTAGEEAQLANTNPTLVVIDREHDELRSLLQSPQARGPSTTQVSEKTLVKCENDELRSLLQSPQASTRPMVASPQDDSDDIRSLLQSPMASTNPNPNSASSVSNDSHLDHSKPVFDFGIAEEAVSSSNSGSGSGSTHAQSNNTFTSLSNQTLDVSASAFLESQEAAIQESPRVHFGHVKDAPPLRYIMNSELILESYPNGHQLCGKYAANINDIALELSHFAITKGSTDNVTTIVIFPRFPCLYDDEMEYYLDQEDQEQQEQQELEAQLILEREAKNSVTKEQQEQEQEQEQEQATEIVTNGSSIVPVDADTNVDVGTNVDVATSSPVQDAEEQDVQEVPVSTEVEAEAEAEVEVEAEMNAADVNVEANVSLDVEVIENKPQNDLSNGPFMDHDKQVESEASNDATTANEMPVEGLTSDVQSEEKTEEEITPSEPSIKSDAEISKSVEEPNKTESEEKEIEP